MASLCYGGWRTLLGGALVAACTALQLPAQAQAPASAPAVAPAALPATPSGTAAVALTAADAEAWLDGLMPAALRMAGVPGAVVVLVKDGKPLLQKGYGFANLATSARVDPAMTLFRPGSVSKLFTWTAVMQLVEQGKLDLDTDLNGYIDFKIPVRNGTPLTLRHVLTHTTGLEDAGRALIVYGNTPADNAKNLKRHVPPYMYDPGTTQGYSNWATALAGYIVERVSKQPFDDYIEQHIFKPLGMQHSTFRQPLPPALQGQMSQGYLTADESPKGFEIVSIAPAGSMAATGADMGRFMQAFLQQGELDGKRILRPETVKLMHTQITRGMPDLNGIGLGFYQQDMNGHRAVGHGGDTILFHSELILLPDDGIGLYVSVNAAGRHDLGKWLRERLYQGFADRYLPDTRPVAVPAVDLATAQEHARMMAGLYRNTRRADSNFFSLLQLLRPLQVEAAEGGRIEIEIGGSRSRFREVKPFLWQEEHGKRRVQAIVENGKVKRWGLEPYVFAFVFEPVPWGASRTMLMLLLGAFGVLLVTVLVWPVAALMRRRHGQAAPGRQVLWVRFASCLALVSAILWGLAIVGTGTGDPSVLLMFAQGTSILAFIGGLAAALWYARSRLGAGIAAHALSGVWVLSFGVLVVIGVVHNLLSFNPNY